MLTPADTAYAIATIRADERALAPTERLLDDPFAAIFAAAGAHAREGTERFLALPFFRDGVRLRTRCIDDVLRDALAAGIGQVVLLGAGFDMRGLRLPAIARHGATVFEVDFAALLARKRSLLDAAGVTASPAVRAVPADFDAPDVGAMLDAALAEEGFRAGAGRVFVCEGVMAYIARASFDALVAFALGAGGPGSVFVFDHGALSFDPDGAEAWALAQGFARFDVHAGDDLWRRYLPGEPHENAWFMRVGVGTA